VSAAELLSFGAMLRMLLALSAAAAVAVAAAAAAGCGSAASAPRQMPIANTVELAAAQASPCELGWLPRAERLIVTESSGGTFGYFEFHAELGGRGPELTGTAQGQYRRLPDSPRRSLSAELRVSRVLLGYVLGGIARGAWVLEEPSRGRVIATDNTESRSIRIEATARIGGVAHHARIETDQGQVEPQPWTVVGCQRALSYEARVRVKQEYERINVLVRRTHMLIELYKLTP
jgi:guanyl-specific ribonuclease Sa